LQLGLLLQAGAEVDAKNAYGSTPLHVACAARASPACMALVQAGADVNAVNNGGWTALHYALRGGEGCNDPALVEWLVRRELRCEIIMSSLWHLA
jgi:ankyrin repeat protein